MNTDFTQQDRTERSYSRAVLIVGVSLGVLVAGAIFLWARHGAAVFHEIIVAGLALCF